MTSMKTISLKKCIKFMTGMPYRIPCVRSFMQKREFSRFQRLWRKTNRHNSTVTARVFPMECVQVGEQSYGILHILSFFPAIEFLRIGSYVSIAEDVHFILSGNHQTSTLTTYPIRSRLMKRQYPEDCRSKGAIIVEDEVWIGYGAIILSGVTIGKGSVIAAGAVVTHDIPPYAIAAGNPAKVVKFRLPNDIIDLVKDCYLKDIDHERIMQHLDQLYAPLQTQEQALQLIHSLKGKNE